MLTTTSILLTLMAGLMTTDAPENFNTKSSAANDEGESHGFDIEMFSMVVTAVAVVANGFVLVALTCGKKGSNTTVNALIMNQTVLDLCAAGIELLSEIIEIVVVTNYDLAGKFYCYLMDNNAVGGTVERAAEFGLVVITLERYIKVVHPIFHRNHYRNWMTKVAVAIPWVAAVIIYFIPGMITTIYTEDACEALMDHEEIYNIFLFIFVVVVPIVTFVACYGQILEVVRRQAKVAQRPNTQEQSSSNVPSPLSKMEKNVTKIMLLVAVSFTVLSVPARLYDLLIAFNVITEESTFAVEQTFLAFQHINRCINPFIYTTQYPAVTNWWRSGINMILRKCGRAEQLGVMENSLGESSVTGSGSVTKTKTSKI